MRYINVLLLLLLLLLLQENLYLAYMQSYKVRLLIVFLHLHEIVEGLYFYFSFSVCVCVSVFEQKADRTAKSILTLSSLSSFYCSRWNPIEIGDLWSKVKVTVT